MGCAGVHCKSATRVIFSGAHLVSLLLSRVSDIRPRERHGAAHRLRLADLAAPDQIASITGVVNSGPTDAAEQALSDAAVPSTFPWVRSRLLEWAEEDEEPWEGDGWPEAGRRSPWPDGSELSRGKRLCSETISRISDKNSNTLCG